MASANPHPQPQSMKSTFITLNPYAEPYFRLNFSHELLSVQSPMIPFPVPATHWFPYVYTPLFPTFYFSDLNSPPEVTGAEKVHSETEKVAQKFRGLKVSENFVNREKKSMPMKRVTPPRLQPWRNSNNSNTRAKRFKLKNSEFGRKTTVMIKNIPNQINRKELLKILDNHCFNENREAEFCNDPFKSEYDFVYLPMDFWYRANLGYAFVNFTNSVAASRFCRSFHNHKWNVDYHRKVCAITWANLQGKETLMTHFQNSVFTCHTDDYLPVIFSPARDGTTLSSPVTVGKRAALIYRKPLRRKS